MKTTSNSAPSATIKVRSNTGGWSKPAEEVAHKYLKDLEQTLRETNKSLRIQKVEEGRTILHDLIGHTSQRKEEDLNCCKTKSKKNGA